MYSAIDYVFQTPIFMVSSTAAPVSNVLEATLTLHECLMKWFDNSAARKINGLARWSS